MQSMQALGIQEGDKVEVHSRRGKIETYAAVGNRVFPQEVFMTFHFPDGNVNEITNAVLMISPQFLNIKFVPLRLNQ